MTLLITIRLSEFDGRDDLDEVVDPASSSEPGRTRRDVIRSEIMAAVNNAQLPYGWVSHDSQVHATRIFDT